jgi:hypothetical protein
MACGGLRAQIVKTEFLTGWMDGSISGGPAKEMLFDPIAKAEADEWDMKKRVYKPIIDRLRSMPKEQRQRPGPEGRLHGQRLEQRRAGHGHEHPHGCAEHGQRRQP